MTLTTIPGSTSNPPAVGSKRKPHPTTRNPPTTKKSALQARTQTLGRRYMAKVTYHVNYEKASANCVYLSQTLYNNLFGAKKTNGMHVKIANVVLRALRDPSITSDNLIDVNFIALEDFEEHLVQIHRNSSIWVSTPELSPKDLAPIKEAHFVVSPCGVLNYSADSEKAVLTSSLESILRAKLWKDPLTLKQSFFIMHPVIGPLKAVLQSWRQGNSSEDHMVIDGKTPYYGLINNQTKIRCTSRNTDSLILADEIDPKKLEKFYFEISKTQNISQRILSSSQPGSSNQNNWKNDVKPLPLIISFPYLSKLVRNRFSGKPLLIGKSEHFEHNPDWVYKVKFIKVKTNAEIENVTDFFMQNVEQNPKVFYFQNRHSMSISPSNEVIFTTDPNNARQATSITMEIIDMDTLKQRKENETPWISVQEIEAKLKTEKQQLVIGEKIVLKVGETNYLLKIVKASGNPCPQAHETGSLKDVWALDTDTKIKVYPKSSLKLEVVDTTHAYKLDAVTVKITIKSGVRGTGGVLAALLGEEEVSDGTKTIVPEEEAKQIFFESLPDEKIIHEKQIFKGLTDKGEEIRFKLDKLQCKEKLGKSFYQGCMYEIHPGTEIILQGEKKGDVIIRTQPKEITLENIDRKLIELGIGGMAEQFKDVIARTTLSRGTFSAHIASLGQKPTRGLLLYGPPGTGKTLLARQLGKILGVSGERIKMYTGSQIWAKYLGESEDNVKEMFKEAREDQNLYGNDSPLHILIIDEIDAFLQSRENAERRHETSVVNTFISELDGIPSEGGEPLKNILVMGLTNVLDKIDDTVKRPGRLFPHIYIGIPDSKGRKEIFGIHTKGIREGGFMGENVDMDELVKMTVGRTGAFIEMMVATAAEYSLKRLWEKRVTPEQINNNPDARIYMEDFLKAFRECLHTKKKEAMPEIIPATPRQKEKIADDLRRVCGLGGLSKEALQFLSDLKNAQYYKKYLCAMKHPFPRGTLLYGPPGIGKRSFAKAIKTMFNLDGPQYQHYKASELWPKQGSGLKETIEKIIQPAKDAANDLKDEAPLHVIVIDEIDKLYAHKRETDNEYQSVLNQFLNELESLFEDDPKEVNNLLVIGIANRSLYGKLPDSILRNSRLGKHLEMTLPNAQGRREICEIYLQKYRENDKLDNSVNIDTLVEMTKDYPGSYIEGLVSEAGILAVGRAAEMGIDPALILSEPSCKLTMNDLREAHKTMKRDETYKQMFT